MTRLGDRIPVAPLDDVTLRRVEDRVVDEMSWAEVEPVRERPAWLRYAPVVAAAVLLAVGAAVLGSFWTRGDETKAPPVAVKRPGPSVKTGPGERATVQLADAMVRVGESTGVAVESEPDGGTVIYLEHGRVECDVTPRPQRPEFKVIAGEVDVTVVGTQFSVERNGDDVEVEVTRGKVRVTRDGQVTFLPAGQRWPAVVATNEHVNEHEHELENELENEHELENEAPSPSPSPNPIPKPIPRPIPKSIRIPEGLPAPHSCTIKTCWDISQRFDGRPSLALYTLIRYEIEARELSLAVKHCDLYERRFPKGAERAAVKTLRKLAE